MTKVKNAQNAGAIAVIVVDIGNFGLSICCSGMAGTDSTIVIPSIIVNHVRGIEIANVRTHTVGIGLTDASPPQVAYTVTGTLGSNDWYTSDVALNWSVTEPQSPTTLRVGQYCVDETITVDQPVQEYRCGASSEGGSSLVLLTIRRDATTPADAPLVNDIPGSSNWYTNDVAVAWNWTDLGSGIDPSNCDQTSGSSGEGSAVLVSSSCKDLAGNTASDSRSFMIDKTSPTVAVTNVSGGAQYTLGLVPLPGCSTSDALSGVATAASVTVTRTGATGAGSYTATCAGAVDNAGNPAAPVSVSYDVVFAFRGFFSPVDNPPTFNRSKAGSAIPVKFSLGGNHGLNIIAAGYPASQQIACNTSAAVDDIEQTTTAGASGLNYDISADQYSYTWKTDKAWSGTCRKLVLRLNDGADHVAIFTFN